MERPRQFSLRYLFAELTLIALAIGEIRLLIVHWDEGMSQYWPWSFIGLLALFCAAGQALFALAEPKSGRTV